MRRHSGLLLACCGAAFAMAFFVLGLEISATTAAPSAQSIDHSAPTVNRTLKADRMPLVPAISRNAVNGPFELKRPPVAKPQLLDGCEAVVSAIGQSPLAQVPGRCVS
jgi:hypothetical protein